MGSQAWLKFDRRVPRYTSYPTAPHFHAGVGEGLYRRWLGELPADRPLSLYLHVPFCPSLCWFCGCHTKVVRRYEPVARYLELVRRELDLVAEALGRRARVVHLHWGGGSPSMLEPGDVVALSRELRARFEIGRDSEFAVEIDPRGLRRESVAALADAGVTRASLGVQDLDPGVQAAVNRVQPFAATAQAVEWLRAAGIRGVNLDLMYGLPRQTPKGLVATVDAVTTLAPDRLALFGYAHVPWMKPHQRLIDDRELPGPPERLAQFEAAAARLEKKGYLAIGLDHFARAHDGLAAAQREGRLRRNFQGYTTDETPALLGVGASAISALPLGYAQSAAPLRAYAEAIGAGRLPTVRGIATDADDRLRWAVIERLMCDLEVELQSLCRLFGPPPRQFAPELEALGELERAGMLEIEGARIRVRASARPFLRIICAVFDHYLSPGPVLHARAL